MDSISPANQKRFVDYTINLETRKMVEKDALSIIWGLARIPEACHETTMRIIATTLKDSRSHLPGLTLSEEAELIRLSLNP